jgi:hypothetical protein
MQRLCDKSEQVPRRRDPICQATHRNATTPSAHITHLLPCAKKSNNEIAFEFTIKDLRNEIHVGNKCSLENDTDIGCVK